MSRSLRCLVALVFLSHVAGVAAERPARLSLVEVTTQLTAASQSILITATEPASYTTRQPDPLTVLVTLRDVDAGGVVTRLPPDPSGPVGAVDVIDAVDEAGATVSEVRITLTEPVAYEVRSRRQTIQVRFARPAATDAARDGAPLAPAAPAARSAGTLLSVETAIEPKVIGVTLRGDGALTPLRIYEAEHLPPRLVLEFPRLAVLSAALTAVQLDPVQQVRVGQNSPEVTRVVLDLVRPSVYEIEHDPSDPSVLRVTFARDRGVDPVAQITSRRPAMPAAAVTPPPTLRPEPVLSRAAAPPAAAPTIVTEDRRRSDIGAAPAVPVHAIPAPVPTVRPVDVASLAEVRVLRDPVTVHGATGQLTQPASGDLPLSTWPVIARLPDLQLGLLRGSALSVPASSDLPPAPVPWPQIAQLTEPSWTVARGVPVPRPSFNDLPPMLTSAPEIPRLAGVVGPLPAEVVALSQPSVADLPFALEWPQIRALPPSMFVVDTAMTPRRYPTVSDLPASIVEPAPRAVVDAPASTTAEALSLAENSQFGLTAVRGVIPVAPGLAARAESQPLSGQPNGGAPQYTGEPISMDFQGTDLRAVLRVFADISGLNLVIDPSVQGEVNVALTQVPWDQAFDIILRANQLDYEVDGTVVRIASIQQLQDEAQDRALLAQREAEAGELIVFTKSLSYAKADDLVQLITQTTLSPRGEVFTDPRTNTLIIRDLAERLATLDALLDTLDRAEPQVEIEARIVQAGHDSARALGVQWGVTGRAEQELGNSLPFQFPNRGGVTGRVGSPGGQGPSGIDPRALPQENAATAVNLGVGAATSALGLTLGSVNGSMNLDVVLSALESQGELAIISSPRVTTQNNVEAEILQGDQIPYQTVANNTVTVQFKEAALTLLVTPQITASNTVIMQVQLENSFADFGRALGDPPIPSIVTQRARTTIQVADGETTVIGGIFENTQTERKNRTPMLHRVPLLGWLFKSTDRSESTDELMIFLTPRIVAP